MDPSNGITRLVANTITGVEDICWLNNKTLLSGKDGVLYKLTLKRTIIGKRLRIFHHTALKTSRD